MTRIKYMSQYGLLWTDWFTVGPNIIIRGVIDTTNFRYEIREFDSSIVMDGTGDSLRHCKELIRQGLIDSGVKFDGEIRRRS